MGSSCGYTHMASCGYTHTLSCRYTYMLSCGHTHMPCRVVDPASMAGEQRASWRRRPRTATTTSRQHHHRHEHDWRVPGRRCLSHVWDSGTVGPHSEDEMAKRARQIAGGRSAISRCYWRSSSQEPFYGVGLMSNWLQPQGSHEQSAALTTRLSRSAA